MTRADLTRKVHDAHGGLTLAHAHALVTTVFQVIEEGLVKDGKVVLSGFGTFRVVSRKERVGRDIRRGVAVPIPSRCDVVFVPSRRDKETRK